MLTAAKNGNLEYLKFMMEARPELADVADENQRGIIAYAIMHRQVDVFNFMCERNSHIGLRTSQTDSYGNNYFHLAAMLGLHGHKSCGVLEMQKELQWFKAGKAIVHPNCIKASNKSGRTAQQLFLEEHKSLMEEAEIWSKQTASSFSVIAALIITIMFPTLLLQPGGDNQSFPFTLHVLCSLISIILASFSLLTFLGIQVTLNSGISFHKIFPRVFILALLTLHLSAASVMIASAAAISLILTGHPEIMKVAISLVGLLVIIFVPLQFRISIEIFKNSLNKMKVLNWHGV